MSYFNEFWIENDKLVRYIGYDEDVIVPDNVTSIGKGAFEHCEVKVKSVTIPNGITHIEENAFKECDRL